MIPETVTLKIPFFCGNKGSVQCWGYAVDGQSKHGDVDRAILLESIPDEEYDNGGAREGTIVVEIPVRRMFENTEAKGTVE